MWIITLLKTKHPIKAHSLLHAFKRATEHWSNEDKYLLLSIKTNVDKKIINSSNNKRWSLPHYFPSHVYKICCIACQKQTLRVHDFFFIELGPANDSNHTSIWRFAMQFLKLIYDPD